MSKFLEVTFFIGSLVVGSYLIIMWFKYAVKLVDRSFDKVIKNNTQAEIKPSPIPQDHTYRFEKWEDAIPYIGKPAIVRMVGYPDITGYLTGISVVVREGKITKGLLEINNRRWDHWRCQPDFKAIKNPALFRVFNY